MTENNVTYGKQSIKANSLVFTLAENMKLLEQVRVKTKKDEVQHIISEDTLNYILSEMQVFFLIDIPNFTTSSEKVLYKILPKEIFKPIFLGGCFL